MNNSETAYVTANGRRYRVPANPTVVITADGGDPRYFDDALARRLMPRLRHMLDTTGEYAVGQSEVPSLTNPNNMSIVTGMPPSVHGIPGNFHLADDGSFQLLNDPGLLRCESIYSAFARDGYPVVAVTTKDKLRGLLGKGAVPAVSVEKAAEQALPEWGIGSVEELVGEPAPDVYDPSASHYCMRIGVELLRRRPDLTLMYVTTTDRVQHEAGPGDQLSDEFWVEFDSLVGAFLDLGATVAITADHGMNSKHSTDRPARVVYLRDVLESAGVPVREIVLPITDPYPKHHGALGSFAWVYIDDEYLDAARAVLQATAGVEETWRRNDAAVVFGLPADRIGDLAVTATEDTALGTSPGDHDLSQLNGPLRTHGGRHESLVPLILSRPLNGPLEIPFRAGMLRNRDIHDLILNNTV